MRKVIAITNRHLVHRDYWDQLEQIVASPVESLVLREKDLSEDEYIDYAKKALSLCNIHGKQCILHKSITKHEGIPPLLYTLSNSFVGYKDVLCHRIDDKSWMNFLLLHISYALQKE